jgi:hypothetical protein
MTDLPDKYKFKYEYAGNLYKSKFDKPEVVEPKVIDEFYDPDIEWITDCKGVGKKLLEDGEEEKDNAEGKMCVVKFTTKLRD